MDTNDLAYLGPYPGTHSRSPIITPATPQTTNNETAWKRQPWWSWPWLTGDWGEMRTALETNGLSFGGHYVGDTSVAWADASQPRGIHRGLVDLNLTFNPAAHLGLEGGRFFAQYYYRYGPHGSDDTEDLQGYDNIDAGRVNRAEEIWYEQNLFEGRLRIKAGQVDANAEFDHICASADFIQSSAGFSPTLGAFPTYPDPALSVNLFYYPSDWLYAGAGIYGDTLRFHTTGRFTRPYGLAEIGNTHARLGPLGPGHAAVGLWNDTAPVDRLDGGHESSASGIYVLMEQQVICFHPEDTNDNRGISVFAQFACADAAVSAINHHVGMGFAVAGPLAVRPADSAGVYWSWAGVSRRTGGLERNEQCLEFYYQCRLTPFFVLKPDLQRIENPGGLIASAAWVATLRAIVEF